MVENDPLAPLARKLGLLGLDPGHQAAFLARVSTVSRCDRGSAVTVGGDAPSNLVTLLSGLGARSKGSIEGDRQIVGFCIPGDFCTAEAAVAGRSDCAVTALTPCTLALIPAVQAQSMFMSQPKLAQALWRDTAALGAIEREWLFNIGRRNARARMAHLICEMLVRFEVAGLATKDRFDFLVTQADLADATGMSTVHVNRSLQALRSEKLITFSRRGEVAVLDRGRLEALAEFTGDYLKP